MVTPEHHSGLCVITRLDPLIRVVTENPLDRVAQQAQEDWTVERVDANTLQLTDAWTIHSILSLGRSVSKANLSYDAPNSALDIQYYFQSNQLGLLFIPMCLDAEPGFVGGALKPIMNGQVTEPTIK